MKQTLHLKSPCCTPRPLPVQSKVQQGQSDSLPPGPKMATWSWSTQSGIKLAKRHLDQELKAEIVIAITWDAT